MSFSDDVGGPSQFATHFPDCLYMSCFVPKIQAVKVAVNLRNSRKKWFFGPRVVGEGDTPDFEHAFSNHTYLRSAMWPDMVEFRSASSDIRGRKNREEEELR